LQQKQVKGAIRCFGIDYNKDYFALLELTYRPLYYRSKMSFHKKLEEASVGKGYQFTNDKFQNKVGNIQYVARGGRYIA